MKKTKKITALLMTTLLITTLAGCGDSGETTTKSSEAPKEVASSETASETSNSTTEASGDDTEAKVVYPVKQLTITCPPAAGGGTDLLVRAMAPKMQEYLGVPVIVMNKPGAGCAIGFSAGAKDPNDGSSITAAVAEMLSVPYVADVDFTYDSFESICNFNSTYGALTVTADAPYNTVEEFIDFAKENPNEISFSNSGIGSNWHVLAAAFAAETEIEVIHVPFDGGGPAGTALAGGHVQACPVSAQEVEVHVASGKAKIIGSFSPERLPELPDVPTIKELGYGDQILTIYRGFVAPKGMDPEIIKMIDDATKYALDDPEITKFMEEKNFMKDYLNAEDFYSLMKREDAIYAEQFEAIGLSK